MAMQALVMGFGGTGAHILTALKEMTVLKHGVKPESIKFLLFDTIADWRPGKTVQIMGGTAEEVVAKGSEEKTSLDPDTEYYYLKDHDPDLKAHVYKLLLPSGSPEKYPHLKDWLNAPWLKVHVREASLSIVEGAAQQRQIGRFATFQNADRIVGRIQKLIGDLSGYAGGSPVNIWLIGSSAGGTGAGCLLDAAYLTRKAAGNIAVTVTGIIVMPDVYGDKEGISRARAYSLFRELERLQGLGIEKGSAEASMGFTSRVYYDMRKMFESSVQKGIFDDIFYLGSNCSSEEQRISFFTSVASAIDPYLDQNSGPVLVQEAVNRAHPALSFGASRLYVPEETFADIFAWEEVEKYLKGVTAPDNNRYVHHGSSSERKDAATTRIANLLPLFDDLLKRAKQEQEYTDDKNRAYVRNTVTPEKIVTDWYRFGGGSIAGIELNQAQKSAVFLTYVNPYISFSETDETKVAMEDRTTKTYEENQKVKGQKENQEESRDRFVRSLDDITRRYLDREGGGHSLEKGRRQVMEIIKSNLHKKVDEVIIGELRQGARFTVNPRNLNEGTVLTQLWAELEYALSDDGPLKKIEKLSGQFVSWLNEEEAKYSQKPVDALNVLKNSKSQRFSFGVWVESKQADARNQCYEYIRWHQKRELLKDMQDFIRSVIERFEIWHRLMRQVLDTLALKEPDAALYVVEKRILDKELKGRLHRLGQNRSALISCEPFDEKDPDLTMQGYREELKKCVDVRPDVTLADEALSATKWAASVDEDGTPQLKLIISGAGGGERAYGTETMSRLHEVLHDHFRKRMEGYLKDRDIFDYLLYAKRVHNLDASRIAQILNSAANILLNAQGDDGRRLIYKNPKTPDKVKLADAIKVSLAGVTGGIGDSEKTYSDKNSITLLKILRPDMDQIQDLNQCKKEYEDMRIADKSGQNKHDTEVYRAQVYHAFRAELEAWFIERKYIKERGIVSEDCQIPPRVVRLLDEPAMMQAFAHCLATGAVEKKEQDDGRRVWVWHDTQNNREVLLVDDSQADVIQAGVVFVIQQREGRKGGLIQITFDAAMKSATDAAKSKEKKKGDMLKEFRAVVDEKGDKNLDLFLKKHLAEEKPNDNPIELKRKRQERLGLGIVLDFYTDPNTETQIQHRMNL